MSRQSILLIPAFVILLSSCKDERHTSYAIKDFRPSLQPFLVKFISKGIVTYEDSKELKRITDDELVPLSKSENPILRAMAFHEILHRSSFNHFDVVMGHLDDTAQVVIDYGEFGAGFRRVSDYMLEEADWQTRTLKNKTIEAVLTKHNYLRSAYIILEQLPPQQQFYPFIKDMATRPRRLDPLDNYELAFNEIEYALFGLAKFRVKEDVTLIKEKLLKHAGELSSLSFRLMKEFPDTAYLDVLQQYHHLQFYQFSGNRPNGFTGFAEDKAAPEDFIDALVVQKNERSAMLLDTMLMYLPSYTCMPDKTNILTEVMKAIWEHPCPAYARLREKIKSKAEILFKEPKGIPVTMFPVPGDTVKRIIRWFN